MSMSHADDVSHARFRAPDRIATRDQVMGVRSGLSFPGPAGAPAA